MILIKEDKSFLSELDLAAINNGLAEMGIYSLRITNFFTEEQKQENRMESETLTREQWSERCEQSRQSAAVRVEKVVDTIHNKFMIYQYRNKDIDYRKDDWDLFFWCNTGDMSYVTLNSNDKRSNERQMSSMNNVLELLKGIDAEGIQVTIQYTTIYNNEKVEEVVLEYCEKMKDKFIEYSGYIGKIVKTENGYLFRKKGAKKQQYYINNNAVLKNVLTV
jgi:hypothetical protein